MLFVLNKFIKTCVKKNICKILKNNKYNTSLKWKKIILVWFLLITICTDLIDRMILTLINDDTLSLTSKQILFEINNKKSSFMLEKLIEIL